MCPCSDSHSDEIIEIGQKLAVMDKASSYTMSNYSRIAYDSEVAISDTE